MNHQQEQTILSLAETSDEPTAEMKAAVLTWQPAYCDPDNAFAMASKAIHGLGKIPGPDTEFALQTLTGESDERRAATAARVLARRQQG